MSRNHLSLPLLAAALPGLVHAQVGVGDPMPEVTIDALYNLEPFKPQKLSELMGPAFLVEYWATW